LLIAKKWPQNVILGYQFATFISVAVFRGLLFLAERNLASGEIVYYLIYNYNELAPFLAGQVFYL
jgi:hypothetical protein